MRRLSQPPNAEGSSHPTETEEQTRGEGWGARRFNKEVGERRELGGRQR